MPGRRTENPGRKKCLCPSTCPHCRSGNNRSPALQQKPGHLLSWSHLPFTHSQLRNRKKAVCKEITRATFGSSDLLVNSVQFLLLTSLQFMNVQHIIATVAQDASVWVQHRYENLSIFAMI